MLAPLDLLPICFSQYRFMDPENSGVPAANTQFDQVVYDLPLQHGIYESYRSGHVPWWDPYGFGGRPLLADAHINGTDPVRLLAYADLPFELAYNWTRIGHFFLCGLTMFVLLRYWQFRTWICVVLALTFEFAGSQTFFFGYPWIQGSLLYYPLLWLGWDAAVRTGRRVCLGLASLAVAGIFYAGNLQSHAYVVVFAAAFALGTAGLAVGQWRKVVPILAISGVCGACLAAPVLLNQLEFFAGGVRAVKPAVTTRAYLTGLACLTSIYPWMLGDFRTLDIRSAFFKSVGFGQNYGLGFHTFIGSAGLILALLGSCLPVSDPHRNQIRRTAAWLAAFFLIIVSSPLITVFYTRSACLFVLAAVVLAAVGLDELTCSMKPFRVLGGAVAAGALALALVVNVGALVIYPRLLPRVRQALQHHQETSARGALFEMPAGYRDFQIGNFPNDVSFKNPETALAFLSLLGLAAVCWAPRLRQHSVFMPLLLCLNVAPAVLFAGRFIPRQPLILWNRLLAGGPEQQRTAAAVRPDHLRLLERAEVRNDFVFPDAMEHLYRVHTVHGYSALVPPCIQSFGLATNSLQITNVADYTVGDGELRRVAGSGLARFHWLTATARSIRVQEPSLGHVRLELSPGPAGTLLWTDTRYPGWNATIDGRPAALQPEAPCFSKLEIPSDARAVVLTYRPRLLRLAAWVALAGLTGLGWLLAEFATRSSLLAGPSARPAELIAADGSTSTGTR